MPKKKTASKRKATRSGAPNKSAYVRSLPTDMPAKDVVEHAKAKGMKLSVEYVYSIRAAAKTTAKRAPKAAPKRRGRPPTATVTSSKRSSNVRVEDLLRAAAAEIGLSLAIGLLQAEQQRVRSVIGR
jgi:hypothetical protein